MSQITEGSPDAKGARELLEREFAIDPWDARLHWLLISHLSRTAGPDAAKVRIAASRKQLPNTQGIDLLAVGVLDEQGNRGAAIELLREAIPRSPRGWALWRRHAGLLAGAHRLKAAWEVLRKLDKLGLNPIGTASLLAEHAELYMFRNRLPQARELVAAANRLEAWQGTVLGATAQLDVREGRVQVGLDGFRKALERYPDTLRYHADRVDALLASGQRDQAIRHASATPEAALKNTVVAAQIARTFLLHGEKALGIEWLDRARTVSPSSLYARDRLMLEKPKLATNLVACRDRALMREWTMVAAADPGKYADIVDRLASNPHPEAVDCLLEAIRTPSIGRAAAVRVARIALIDIDLTPLPSPAELEAAHARLSAWWAKVRSRYEDWQLE